MDASPNPPALRHAVAEEVRAILGRRRWNGARLAKAIDRSEMYVSRRLRGETAFDLDDLEVIARELGVSVSELIRGGGSGSQTTVPKLRVPEHPMPGAEGTTPVRGSAGRPRDNRPKGRPSASIPNPNTRRPSRLTGPPRTITSAA